MLNKESLPTISVIIPTYNRSNLLKRAINSVLNQTFKDFELIVVDDNSADDTKEVVNRFGAGDSRIKYIRHKRNKGGSAARNTGIKHAKGEYIALLDDDDEWLPEKLEKQLNKFSELPSEYGVVYTGFSFSSESGTKIDIQPIYHGRVFEALLEKCILGSPTPLIKKFCFRKAGLFDEKLPGCQDWDMWLRISKYYKFDFVSKILAKHYVHGQQISVNLRDKISARNRFINKHWFELNKHPEILGKHFNRIGILYSLANQPKVSQDFLLKSIIKYPYFLNIVQLIVSKISYKFYNHVLRKYYVTEIDGIRLYY